jgi:hypothetical protein
MQLEELVILHLSDLHIAKDALDEGQSRQWYETLCEDLRSTATAFPPIATFLVVTGDITLAGQKEEFEVADQLLSRILEITQIPRNHFLFVPGNHDVNRKSPNPEGLANFYQFYRNFDFRSAPLEGPLRTYDKLGLGFLLSESGPREPDRSWKRIAEQVQPISPGLRWLIKLSHDANSDSPVQQFKWGPKWWKCDADSLGHNSYIFLHGHPHYQPSLRLERVQRISSFDAGPLSCESWRHKMVPPRYRILKIGNRTVTVRTRTYFHQADAWVELPDVTLPLKALDSQPLPIVKPMVKSDKAGRLAERAKLQSMLSTLPEDDLSDLILTLKPAVSRYLPAAESKSAYIQRVIDYFEHENSLRALTDAVQRYKLEDTRKSLRVFVSFAASDRFYGRLISETAKNLGFDVVNRDHSHRVSHPLESAQDIIKNADVFLVLLSNAAAKSKWVRHELDSAVERALTGKPIIVPLRLDECEVPEVLKDIPVYRIERDDKKLRSDLIQALLQVYK